MTEEEKVAIRNQYNRLLKVEDFETKIEQLKEVQRTLTGTLGNFPVDWNYTVKGLCNYTNDHTAIKTVFNYDLTRQEFRDILKSTIYNYLTGKITELEQQMRGV